MYCYTLVDGVFQPANDPIGESTSGNGYQAQLNEAGYLRQLTSIVDPEHSEITLYATSKTDKPRYYIDITGNVGQMAVLLANDFPHLIATLKEIAPLVSLVGLSQQREMHAELLPPED
ncbi:MAG: hypothetical protein Q7K57_11785 [Burkholderiaceae bacterium]|nr:hypothetical protein [Burkholderiaceae bacterium]